MFSDGACMTDDSRLFHSRAAAMANARSPSGYCVVEVIITAGGENVSPVLIEDAVREQLSCVSNCMLIGDRRKFLSMLITLKVSLTCCYLPCHILVTDRFFINLLHTVFFVSATTSVF